MKSLNILVLLTVLLAAPYVFAQVPSCPCDTLQLQNGTTGDDIIDILCPDGQVIPAAEVTLTPEHLRVGTVDLAYQVDINEGTGSCVIAQSGGGEDGLLLLPQDTENCRQRLIQGCNLRHVTNIPTLTEWGTIAMAGVLGLIGLFAAARRRKAAA